LAAAFHAPPVAPMPMPLFRHFLPNPFGTPSTLRPPADAASAHEEAESLHGSSCFGCGSSSSQAPVLASEVCAARLAEQGVSIAPAPARAPARLQKVITIHSMVLDAVKDPAANYNKNLHAVETLREERTGGPRLSLMLEHELLYPNELLNARQEQENLPPGWSGGV